MIVLVVMILSAYVFELNGITSSDKTTTMKEVSHIILAPNERRIHLIHVFNPFVMKKKHTSSNNDTGTTTIMPGYEEESLLFDLLGFEQWVVIQSLRRALPRINSRAITVDVVCAMYEEDFSQLERLLASLLACRTVFLNRSTVEEYPFLQPPQKLPFLQEIFDASTSSTKKKHFYWMYMNSDIGISRDFYNHLLPLLYLHDALSINRVTLPRIPETDQTITHFLHKNIINNNQSWFEAYIDDHITTGVKHPGYDCFIIHSNISQRIHFGDFFAGYPPWGANIHHLLKIMTNRYKNIKSNAQGTFHFGDEMSWKSSAQTPRPNQIQLMKHCPIPAGSMTPYSIQNTMNCGKWWKMVSLQQMTGQTVEPH